MAATEETLPPIDWDRFRGRRRPDSERRGDSFDTWVEMPQRNEEGEYFQRYAPVSKKLPYIMHSGSDPVGAVAVGPKRRGRRRQVVPLAVIEDAYDRARFFEDQNYDLRHFLDEMRADLAAARHTDTADCEHCAHVFDVVAAARSQPPARNNYYPFYVNQLGQDWRPANTVHPAYVGDPFYRHNHWLDYDPLYGVVSVPPMPATARYPQIATQYWGAPPVAAMSSSSPAAATRSSGYSRGDIDDAALRYHDGLGKLGRRYYGYRH